MKFLIIRFSSIGDIVLTTPVVRCLKKQLPDAELHYVTKPQFKTILENNPYLDKLHLLSGLKTTIGELKNEKFDYIIDLHHNLRTWRIKTSMLNVKSYSFNKLNIEKWLMTNFKINLLPKKHIVDRYLDTVTFSGVRNDGRGLDYFIPEKDVVQPSHLPATHLHGFITIAIGAAHNTKKLPLHKLKQLCAFIDHPVVLLGGKEDVPIAEAVTSTDPIKIYNACGKFNLNESADLIRKSKLLVTLDTGLMHIATALQKPTVSVWGNTVPQFGMYPYYGNYNIQHTKFEIQHLPCRPCSKIGYNKCPLTHFKCMELHDMHELSKAITGFLKN